MKRRITSFVLALAMCLTLLPAAALADDADVELFPVTVNGIELGGGKGDYLESNDSTAAKSSQYGNEPAQYVAWYKNNVLYLNGLDITTNESTRGIEWVDGTWMHYGLHLTIVVTGENSITSLGTMDEGDEYGIAINGRGGTAGGNGTNLTIQGDGTLNLTGYSHAISVGKHITFAGNVTVNATSIRGAAVTNTDSTGKITVRDKANVTAEGGPYGFGCTGSQSTPVIAGGTVTASGTQAAFQSAPSVEVGMAITAGADENSAVTVSAVGTEKYVHITAGTPCENGEHTYDKTNPSGKCIKCGYECTHGEVGEDHSCTICGMTMGEAVLIRADGTTQYGGFFDLLSAAAGNTGSTLKLLQDTWSDKKSTIWNGSFTIDLNGHSVTFAGENGGMVLTPGFVGTNTVDVKLINSDLEHPAEWRSGQYNPGIYVGNIKDSDSHYATDIQLTVGSPVAALNGEINFTVPENQISKDTLHWGNGVVKLYTGNYMYLIKRGAYCNDRPYSEMLADGCAFFDAAGKLINAVQKTENLTAQPNWHVGPHTHDFTGNGTDCACGLHCEHKTVDTENVCTNCHTQMKAKLRAGNTTSYYVSLPFAFAARAAAIQNATVTLLADHTMDENSPLVLSSAQNLTLDLGGHSILGQTGTFTIQKDADYAMQLTLTGNGTIEPAVNVEAGNVTIQSGTYAEVHIAGGTMKLQGGEFGRLKTESGTLEALLDTGRAFHRTGTGAIVPGNVQELRDVKVLSGHEHLYDVTGKCACGASVEALLTKADGTSIYFPTLQEAVGRATTVGYENSIVTVLRDVTTDEIYVADGQFTIDLNGCTVTSSGNTLLLNGAKRITLTLRNSNTQKTAALKTTGNNRTALELNAAAAEVTIGSANAAQNGQIQFISDDSLGSLRLSKGMATLYTGTFSSIKTAAGTQTLTSLLAEDKAFYQGGTVVSGSVQSLNNVTVQQHDRHSYSSETGLCACGKSCPHGSFDESGKCTECQKQMTARVTTQTAVTYYDTLAEAAAAAVAQNGCTLTLLADSTATEEIQLSGGTVTFDLNGHAAAARLNITDATSKLMDSSDGAGSIGGFAATEHALGAYLATGYYVATESAEYDLTANLPAVDALCRVRRMRGSAQVFANNTAVTAAEDGTFSVYTGQTVRVQASVLGAPAGKITYKWYWNDAEQSGQTGQTLEQTAAQAGTANVRCTATLYGGTLYEQTVEVPAALHTTDCGHPGVDGQSVCTQCGAVMAAELTHENAKSYFAAPQEAISAAQSGDTVRLLQNVLRDEPLLVQDKDLTLDTNGKSFSSTWGAEDTECTFQVENANLTLINTGAKKSSITAKQAFYVQNSGSVTVGRADDTEDTILCFVQPGKLIGTSGGEACSFTIYSGIFGYLDDDLDDNTDYTVLKISAANGDGVGKATLYGGRIDGITVENGTLADVLPEGYTLYRSAKNIWYYDSDLSDAKVTVTVRPRKKPIQSMTVTASKNTYSHGEDVLLTADVTTAEDGAGVSYRWYTVTGETASLIENAAAASYTASSLNVGTHTFRCEAAVEGYVVTKDVTVPVTGAPAVLTKAPAAVSGLVYKTSAQELVTAGAATGGKVVYRLGADGAFTEDIPTATNAGSYVVWYMVQGDENHSDTEAQSVQVSIGQADPAYTIPGGRTATYGDTLANVTLPAGWSWQDDTKGVGDVGTNRFAATFTPDDPVNYKTATGILVDVLVLPKLVVPAVTVSGDWAYTGSAITPVVRVTADGVTLVEDTDYTVSYGTNIDAGKQAGSVTVTAKDGSNYTFAAVTEHFEIAQRAVTLTGVTVQDKVYDGLKAAVVNSRGTLSNAVSGKGPDYTIRAAFADANVGEGKPVQLTVTLTGEQAGNYTLAENSQAAATADIRARALENLNFSQIAVTKVYDGTKNAGILTGTVGFTGRVGSDDVAIAAVPGPYADENAGEHKTVMLALHLKGAAAANYTLNDADKTHAFTEASITPASGSMTAPEGVVGLVYDGDAQTLIRAGSANGTGEIQYRLEGGSYEAALPAAANAGTYTVYYKVVGDGNHEDVAEASLEVRIAKRTATVTVLDRFAYVGAAAPALDAPVPGQDYTVDGVLNGDTLGGSLVLDYARTPDMSQTGTVSIVASGLDGGQNYSLVYQPGTLTIGVRSTGATGYPVLVVDKTVNGTITVTPKNAVPGSLVTIRATPDSGYHLGELTVTDRNGEELNWEHAGGGKYIFRMPSGRVTVTGSFVRGEAESLFRDVAASAYYYEAVQWAASAGITGGIGNDLFGPQSACTRAQIVTFLWRAADSLTAQYAAGFADVAANSYYAAAVAWAVENGVTSGIGNGSFGPNGACTRAQAVTFLWRAEGAPEPKNDAVFTDVPKDAYYAKAVAWAVENGITTGTGNGKFSPNDVCTRAQIVTLLFRAEQGK